jgi:hypothetical protein
MLALLVQRMGEDTMELAAARDVEAILAEELARESRAMSAVVPVLRHLLASDTHALVSEAVLARVRGMLTDLAAQVLAAGAGHDPSSRYPHANDPAARDDLATTLSGHGALLSFCHALANESLLAERLQQRHGIDPVLTPLVQELIASADPAIAALAMNMLASQSRFMQSQRRMELPLGELPPELFHAVLASTANPGGLRQVQNDYDEASSRLGLLARLVSAMRRGVVAALSLDHAGLALFTSALAAHTRLPRESCVIACHEGQGARLALALRSAGLGLPAMERQFLLVEPSARMPRAIAELSPERARLMLDADDPAGYPAYGGAR